MPFHRAYAGIEQSAIGCLIKEFRQTLHLTQEKFAAQIGTTFLMVNRWGNLYALPSSLALRQIDSLLKQLNSSSDLTLDLTLCELSKTLQVKHFSLRKEQE